MKKYVVTCCSTIDMNLDFFKENDISYIPFTFMIDNQEYFDDYGQSYPIKDFYNAMRDGKVATTSQVNVSRYTEFFSERLKAGYDVLHLTLSSGITGTINSARLAASSLNDEYENKVYVVDSLAASSGYGLLVTLVKENLDKGMSIEENLKWIEENKLTINHWFFTTDLTYLVRGGRVSKASGFIGNTLHICPLLNVSDKGTLIAREKIRGKRKVINEMVNKMYENALNGIDYDGKVYISSSDDEEDANELAKLIKEHFKNVKEVKMFSIGTVIGAHTGPGTVALFFVGKKRID